LQTLNGIAAPPVPPGIAPVVTQAAVVSLDVATIASQLAPIRPQSQPGPGTPVTPEFSAIRAQVVTLPAEIAEAAADLPPVLTKVDALPDPNGSLCRRGARGEYGDAQQQQDGVVQFHGRFL
jgi:hypothetical protein